MDFKRLFIIAFKDLRLIFRDRSALVLMLLAPFVLTLGMGALTGRFSGAGTSTFEDIPFQVVNQDQGELAAALIQVFESEDLAALLAPEIITDPVVGRQAVDSDKSAAFILIPAGFSASVLSPQAPNSVPPQIEFYENPTRPNSAGLLRSILDQFLAQVEIGRVSAQVVVTQLLQHGLIAPAQAAEIGKKVGVNLATRGAADVSAQIEVNQEVNEAPKFDILAYMAPGMAMMFLMFTVTYGARSLLVENRDGTLQRMLVAPTSAANVLGGKFAGIFLTAVAQLLILIGGTSLLFRLQWGDPLAVWLLILAAAVGATGWGVFFAALLKTPGQVAATGSAVMLLFGLLGGTFFDISILPGPIQVFNKITPNAWANAGFSTLSAGGGLRDIQPNILALLVMGLVLFGVASVWISRRGLGRK